jgi:hypothetical protein
VLKNGPNAICKALAFVEVEAVGTSCLCEEDAQIAAGNVPSALRCCFNGLVKVLWLSHVEASHSRSTSLHTSSTYPLQCTLHLLFLLRLVGKGFCISFWCFSPSFPLRACSPLARFCVASLYGSLSPLVLFISCSFCSCALPHHTPTWFSSHFFSLFLLRIGRVTIQQRHLVQWRQ